MDLVLKVHEESRRSNLVHWTQLALLRAFCVLLHSPRVLSVVRSLGLHCQRVIRPYPDMVLLCGVRGTEEEFIGLLRGTHLGLYVFRVYFCSEPPTANAGTVAAFYGEKAGGLVCRMQCYPRSVEAAMGKAIPMNVDLRMSNFSVVGSVVKLPADQLRAAGEGVGQDRNMPWRPRKKEQRSEQKRKKHKQSKWEAAAGAKAAAVADAAAAATAAEVGGGEVGGDGAGADTDGEKLGNAVEADLSKLEAEGMCTATTSHVMREYLHCNLIFEFPTPCFDTYHQTLGRVPRGQEP